MARNTRHCFASDIYLSVYRVAFDMSTPLNDEWDLRDPDAPTVEQSQEMFSQFMNINTERTAKRIEAANDVKDERIREAVWSSLEAGLVDDDFCDKPKMAEAMITLFAKHRYLGGEDQLHAGMKELLEEAMDEYVDMVRGEL